MSNDWPKGFGSLASLVDKSNTHTHTHIHTHAHTEKERAKGGGREGERERERLNVLFEPCWIVAHHTALKPNMW